MQHLCVSFSRLIPLFCDALQANIVICNAENKFATAYRVANLVINEFFIFFIAFMR